MEKSKIAIASGKGGTGKTFVATNLFNTLLHEKMPATIVDCDAEEPNVHLFFKGTFVKQSDVYHNVPVIDETVCTHCGRCHEYCSYNAIFHVPSLKVIKVMDELCHGCGACFVACCDNAIHIKQKSLGSVKKIVINNQFYFVEARTRVGVFSSVKVINAAIAETKSDAIVIFDSPPGISCPFIQTANMADYIVLVTEPTPFGLSDLKQSVETLKQMNKMMGVVVNKLGIGNTDVYDYLKKNNIPLLMEIPFSREIANAYSTGVLITSNDKNIRNYFMELFEKIGQELWKSQL